HFLKVLRLNLKEDYNFNEIPLLTSLEVLAITSSSLENLDWLYKFNSLTNLFLGNIDKLSLLDFKRLLDNVGSLKEVYLKKSLNKELNKSIKDYFTEADLEFKLL
ncbi:MAG: hypothetical protein AAGK97_13330, partial [Bacteroidota bacterium]